MNSLKQYEQFTIINPLTKRVIKLLESHGYRLLSPDEEYTDQSRTIQIMGSSLLYTPNCTIEIHNKGIMVNEVSIDYENDFEEVY